MLVTLAALALAAGAPDHAVILLQDGYASPTALRIWGRVLAPTARAPEQSADSELTNVARMLSDLESDELRDVDVSVTVAGQTFVTTSDKNGVFVVLVKGLTPPFAPGSLAVTATAGQSQATATLHVSPAAGVAVVSDIDDTVVKTFVTEKLKMAEVVFTKNATQLEPVEGAAATYRRAQASGVDAFFYLSGSPQNLALRLRKYLADNGFPAGPMLLKNLGKDSLFSHDDYKLSRLRELALAHPGLRFVLVGDSGERDPEIYRAFRAMHPERVVAVVIRLVPGSKHLEPERFAGMTTVDNGYVGDGALTALLPSAASASAPTASQK